MAVPLYAAPVVGSVAAPVKIKRLDWSSGENLQAMTKAVEDWDNKTGKTLEHDPLMSLIHYAGRVEIPYNTLRKFVADKRRVLGAASGKKTLLDSHVQRFTVDMLRARDRANDGMNKRQALDMIQDLRPELKLDQIRRAFDRRIRPGNVDVLTGIVKAQASTEKRSQITVPQQYRWHTTIDSAFNFLRNNNLGTTLDGKSFGEVMPHFVLGGDETGLLASNGDVSIIGDKAKRKHEVSTAGSRTSITVYRCSNAAGNDGPTGFLPPGKYGKLGYNDNFLMKHGAAPGSTIVMKDTGYMTEAAWLELAPSMARVIRQMPVTTPIGELSRSSMALVHTHRHMRRWRSTRSTRSCCSRKRVTHHMSTRPTIRRWPRLTSGACAPASHSRARLLRSPRELLMAGSLYMLAWLWCASLHQTRGSTPSKSEPASPLPR